MSGSARISSAGIASIAIPYMRSLNPFAGRSDLPNAFAAIRITAGLAISLGWKNHSHLFPPYTSAPNARTATSSTIEHR